MPGESSTPELNRSIPKRAKIFKARLAATRGKLETARQRAESAEGKSMTDELTGLPNRRWFFEELNRRMADARRSGRSVWVLIADLDHFKTVNDKYGHPKGDEVLKSWGNITARSEEPFARYGGEEFVQIIQDGQSLEEIQAILSRYSINFGDSTENILGGDRRTLSYGLARMELGDTTESLIRKADKALYYSKAHGRDRLTIFEGTTDTPRYNSLPILRASEIAQKQTVSA